MSDWIELYRAFVPKAKILNDNSGQHYRIMMGKTQWLENQFEAFLNEDDSMGSIVGGMYPKDSKEVYSLTEGHDIILRTEIWRPVNRRFDVQNYEKTTKAPIDLLNKNGYFEDDNWNYIDSAQYGGGGERAWRRSYRTRNVNYEDEPKYIHPDGLYEIMADGLPKDMNVNWWKEYSDDYGDIFIRILIQVLED